MMKLLVAAVEVCGIQIVVTHRFFSTARVSIELSTPQRII
jgi:hypothetical protein